MKMSFTAKVQATTKKGLEVNTHPATERDWLFSVMAASYQFFDQKNFKGVKFFVPQDEVALYWNQGKPGKCTHPYPQEYADAIAAKYGIEDPSGTDAEGLLRSLF